MDMPPPPPPPPPHFGGPAAGGGRPDRKTVERNRRNQMNALYSRLDQLVRAGSSPSSAPPCGPPAMTRPDRLEEAAAYIRQTTERVERLKERKRELTAARAASSSQGSSSAGAAAEVEVQHLGSGLHAILVTGAPPSDGASFHRAVRAVEEAGGEVQNAHFSVVGARAIYTIHTLVAEGGIERVVQRLKAALRGDA
ncbi:transcription factor bHLH162-like isoform X2 [Panicum hallii]|uniref:transcription factor bHLH162-like isoform X2 n=1 Tax=Panicum hallii TaxID=206008 RepID=UPI000DF4CAED|nr:transcription factor bHLH162-like isoform X2 [Panicum hallii]